MLTAPRLAAAVLAVALTGCASSNTPADRIVYAVPAASSPAITPAEMWERPLTPPPPENDISEEERGEWFRNNYGRQVQRERDRNVRVRERVTYVETDRDGSWWRGPGVLWLGLAGLTAYWSKRYWDDH